MWCTWEIWRVLKRLQLLKASLSCSPNFPCSSITRYTLAKHESILIKKLFLWKVRKCPKKKAEWCHTTHLTRSQRVNKLLSLPELGIIICLIRRRQCEQVLMRSQNQSRSIWDPSHFKLSQYKQCLSPLVLLEDHWNCAVQKLQVWHWLDLCLNMHPLHGILTLTLT